MIVSTPRMRPILEALEGSARSLLLKFCSAMILSRAARSMTRYLPSVTSFWTMRSVMPLPTSWSVPKMEATTVLTVP